MDNFTLKTGAEKGDLGYHRSNTTISRLRRKILSHVVLVRGFLIFTSILLTLGLFFLFLSFAGKGLDNLFFWPKMAAGFILGSPSSLENNNGRTNILILGVGGAGHEAPELTDTMMFVSLDHKRENPVFLSLPRDIWVPSMEAKINTVYQVGKHKKEGGGLILSKSSVSEILGQPVHYALAIDFSAFSKIVDTLGGVEVEVDRTFDDYRYPIAGRENDECALDPEFACRYEHINFQAGEQTMNGETALKFVRSRNSQGEEGTDFARSTRQQKVIEGIKEKVFSPGTLFSPKKISSLWSTVFTAVDTDIPRDKLPIIARMFAGISRAKIKTLVLDGGTVGDAQTGFLVNPPISAKYNNQWVLIPRDGTWEEVKTWIDGILLMR